MKYSYDVESFSQVFTFFIDTYDDSFSVTVTGSPADVVLFDMMLKSNGLIYADMDNKGGSK